MNWKTSLHQTRWPSRLAVALMAVALLCPPLLAQRKGSNAKISVGRVVMSEPVQLQSDAAKGALLGGVVGYQATSSKKSKSKKWRNSMIGAGIGGAGTAKAQGSRQAIMYTVDLGNGSRIQVVTDQTEVRKGDCVAVEEVKDTANIRRIDPAACEPSAAQAVVELQDEFEEEAKECLRAKEDLVDAQTEKALELALKKVEILCND